MRDRAVLVAVAGSGTAWIVHFGAAYVVVALGCPRGWPALGWLLAALTVVCASAALAVGVFAFRRRRRAARGNAAGEAQRLLFAVGILLAALFALAVVAGGVAVVALPPCQPVAIGGAA
jgi:hypothetical protein